MRTNLILVVVGLSVLLPEQLAGQSYRTVRRDRRLGGGSGYNYYQPPSDPYAAERQRQAELELKKMLENTKSEAEAQQARDQIETWRNFVPEDPYRILNVGSAVYAKGDGWVKFGGKVIEVSPSGILVDGSFRSLNEPFRASTYRGRFFVANFPYASTNGSPALCVESYSDFTAYEQTGGGSADGIRRLEYGRVVAPPPPSAELVNYVVQAAESDITTDANTLKWNQEQADKGDAYGQLRMGERYLYGDGIEKNLTKAREYLLKAAAQGNTVASNELQNLKP